jgi:hypothetical protein
MGARANAADPKPREIRSTADHRFQRMTNGSGR